MNKSILLDLDFIMSTYNIVIGWLTSCNVDKNLLKIFTVLLNLIDDQIRFRMKFQGFEKDMPKHSDQKLSLSLEQAIATLHINRGVRSKCNAQKKLRNYLSYTCKLKTTYIEILRKYFRLEFAYWFNHYL